MYDGWDGIDVGMEFEHCTHVDCPHLMNLLLSAQWSHLNLQDVTFQRRMLYSCYPSYPSDGPEIVQGCLMHVPLYPRMEDLRYMVTFGSHAPHDASIRG